ncbi:MAG: succinate dehydrogenase cytochrome b subunit [Planctomycetia bacterium]|nr:succinate dehydrogenase cytochrome b subunit [Planctomycetia bacterium]
MGGSTGCWVSETLRSSIGKKGLMAVTGLMLFGFVVIHLLGNLQVYLPDKQALTQYGHLIKSKPAVLWGARLSLLAIVLVHAAAAILLAMENSAARPVKYHVRQWREAGYAARTMIISGPLILAYVVYHLLHFTTGHAHPDFNPDDVYRNVIVGFQNKAVALTYIVAMVMLATHLSHGLWSLCQTLGFNHPKYTPALRFASIAVATAIGAGYISIPVSVMLGILK